MNQSLNQCVSSNLKIELSCPREIINCVLSKNNFSLYFRQILAGLNASYYYASYHSAR